MANFNAFDAFEPARQAAYESMGQQRQDRGRIRAGQALQRQDYTGGASELYGAGDLQGGMQVQQGQEHQQDRQTAATTREHEQRMQDLQQKAGFLKAAAVALRKIPMEQRAQAYHDHVGPALQEMGMDPQAVQAAAGHLDDASLDAFAPDIDKQIQAMNLGNGGLATFNNRTGEVNVVREPYRDPLAGELTQARIESTRAQTGQRNASAAHLRRPAASGGRGASPAVPHGFVLD